MLNRKGYGHVKFYAKKYNSLKILKKLKLPLTFVFLAQKPNFLTYQFTVYF